MGRGSGSGESETSLPGGNEDSSDQPHSSNATNASSGSTTSWLKGFSEGIASTSDRINDNLVIARYATFSTIALLTCYGVSNSPLFFRYRNVRDIPPKLFVNRRTLTGHIVGTKKGKAWNNNCNHQQQQQQQQDSVIVLVQHLSPMDRLWKAFQRNHFVRWFLPGFVVPRRQEAATALRVELAGVTTPPEYGGVSVSASASAWWGDDRQMQTLCQSQSLVKVQLLARRHCHSNVGTTEQTNTEEEEEEYDTMVAVGKLSYTEDTGVRNGWWWRFLLPYYYYYYYYPQMDLASTLVANGSVHVVSSGKDGADHPLVANQSESSTMECLSPRPVEDSAYLDQLCELESKAILSRVGMWADERIRQSDFFSATVREVEQEEEIMRKKSWWERMVHRLRERF